MTAQTDHRSSNSEMLTSNTLNQQGETQSPQLTVTAEIHTLLSWIPDLTI